MGSYCSTPEVPPTEWLGTWAGDNDTSHVTIQIDKNGLVTYRKETGNKTCTMPPKGWLVK